MPRIIGAANEIYGAFDRSKAFIKRREGKAATRPPFGQRGASLDDHDKASMTALLEKSYRLPDPRVLQASVAAGPFSGKITQIRRDLLQVVFLGAAFDRRLWKTFAAIDVANEEDLVACFKTTDERKKGMAWELYDVASKVASYNFFIPRKNIPDDDMIKELDGSTWEMYLSLKEQTSVHDFHFGKSIPVEIEVH